MVVVGEAVELVFGQEVEGEDRAWEVGMWGAGGHGKERGEGKTQAGDLLD